jgi:hypothetical protein
MQEKTRTYEVESTRNKDRRFTVVLEPLQSGVKAECDCNDYLAYGCWCEHIERAVSCYRYGL